MSSQTKYCPNCGAQNDGDAIFCSSCGNRFDQPSKSLGVEEEPQSNQQKTNAQSSHQYEPQPEKMASPDMEMDQDNKVDGIFGATVKMITDPQTYSVRILGDPNSPSALPLFLIRVVLVAFVGYLKFSQDAYFDMFYRSTVEELTEQMPYSVAELRELYLVSIPIMFSIGLFLLYFVGSWIMGLLIKGGLHPQSPLKNNPSRAMRQLNGYRQAPLVVGQLIALILILTVPPETFLAVMGIVLLIVQVVYGLILWRGLGPHVGYNGSVHKIIAGAIFVSIFFQLF